MIRVSQGHQEGIGLEVFLKSLAFISQEQADNLKLYADLESLERTLDTLPHHSNINTEEIFFSGKRINLNLIPASSQPSTTSLNASLNDMLDSDTLFTLPTSKDQLTINHNEPLGYTEFFREHFNNRHISMCFKSGQHISALLTDHLPLNKVVETLNENYIREKALIILDNIERHFFKLEDIFFTGINPHSGENGRMGNEEEVLVKVIKFLKKKWPNIESSIIPADTVHFHLNTSRKQLFIYAYHDQALSAFKQRQGLYGANISLGMPFKRLSVDHGTAFSLFGKNKADSSGCLYCLKEALRWT